MDISMFVLVTCPPVFVLLYIFLNWWVINHKSVCIVVLGDLGRSPRMQYHSLSFAKEGYSVDFVGYSGTRPHEELVKNENITMYYVSTPPNFNKFFPTLVAYILKVIWQSVTLGIKLLLLPKSHLIMLQNPPSIPPMIVAVVVCVLRGSYLLIDWHNYGYTILGLSLGERHPLVKISRVYEKIVGRASRYNLCVTDAMKKDLERNWNICAKTLHDRPPSIFREFSIGEKHDLFVKLSEDYPVFRSTALSSDSTVFTKKSPDGTVNYLKERPALLISSTSWTEDEDFGILLKSLQDYEKMANMDETMPSILCVITGKGPLKEYYSKKLQELHWKKIQYCLPWLKAEDYPVLLGSADLGVCLHKSSSGLDLPMKVVDMFGCGLPVCAVGYSCIDELVHDRVNGRIFDTSEELCQQIKELLSDFKGEQKTLSSMRHNLKQFQALRWHQNWTNVVLPLISDG